MLEVSSREKDGHVLDELDLVCGKIEELLSHNEANSVEIIFSSSHNQKIFHRKWNEAFWYHLSGHLAYVLRLKLKRARIIAIHNRKGPLAQSLYSRECAVYRLSFFSCTRCWPCFTEIQKVYQELVSLVSVKIFFLYLNLFLSILYSQVLALHHDCYQCNQ